VTSEDVARELEAAVAGDSVDAATAWAACVRLATSVIDEPDTRRDGSVLHVDADDDRMLYETAIGTPADWGVSGGGEEERFAVLIGRQLNYRDEADDVDIALDREIGIVIEVALTPVLEEFEGEQIMHHEDPVGWVTAVEAHPVHHAVMNGRVLAVRVGTDPLDWDE
jgi:hypothetical protein